MQRDTCELVRGLRLADSFDDFQSDREEDFLSETPREYLNRKLFEKRMNISDVCKAAGLTKYCYKVFSQERTASRNMLLRIAIGMQLNLEETQQLLRVHQMARLDPRVRRDAALIFAVSKGFDLAHVQELLEKQGEETL